MSKILVKKKKGYVEEFDIDKVKKSLLNAGCKEDEADKISKEIREWAEKQPEKIIHSFEIEKQVLENTKEKHKDILISFLFYAKNKIKPMKRVFNRKDIAQMLTSLFVIIQIYVIESVTVSFSQAIPVLITSLITCSAILWLIEGKQMLRHLIFGFILVSLLSLIVGEILDVDKPEVLLAISVGLPVAAMVDVLGNKD